MCRKGVRRFPAPPYVIDYEVADGGHARQNDPDIAADTRDDFEDF